MSLQGDQMRAAATALETAAMNPWTAALPEVATNAAGLLRNGATATDRLISLNLF